MIVHQQSHLATSTLTIEHLLSTATLMLTGYSDSAMLDAEILLAHTLNRTRTWLRTWPEYPVSQYDHETYQQMLSQRVSGIPVAYLTCKRDFWRHSFHVTPDVLIPRPDTELLVELALQIIPSDEPFLILELGTGSGAVSISLGAERPKSLVTATDISPSALTIASENAKTASITNINFMQSNWFSRLVTQKYDMIISNPPYVRENDPHLSQGDVRFEPRQALTSGIDGLRDIRIIANQARGFLADNAWLTLEHGYNQAGAVRKILNNNQYHNIKNLKDLQGNPRVTIAQYSNRNNQEQN